MGKEVCAKYNVKERKVMKKMKMNNEKKNLIMKIISLVLDFFIKRGNK